MWDADDDEFLLLASDGLYDVLKDQEAVDYVRRKICELGDVQRAVEVRLHVLYVDGAATVDSNATGCMDMWQSLVEHAIFQQRSMDNVTAVVVMFKAPADLQASV